MFIIIDDLYSELISHLGLVEQLKFRCTNKFHANRINSDLLKEYFDFKTNHDEDKINFTNVCKFGYLKLAKWLHQFDNNLCIGAKNNFVFAISCKNGHFEVRGSKIPEQTLVGNCKMVISIRCQH